MNRRGEMGTTTIVLLALALLTLALWAFLTMNIFSGFRDSFGCNKNGGTCKIESCNINTEDSKPWLAFNNFNNGGCSYCCVPKQAESGLTNNANQNTIGEKATQSLKRPQITILDASTKSKLTSGQTVQLVSSGNGLSNSQYIVSIKTSFVNQDLCAKERKSNPTADIVCKENWKTDVILQDQNNNILPAWQSSNNEGYYSWKELSESGAKLEQPNAQTTTQQIELNFLKKLEEQNGRRLKFTITRAATINGQRKPELDTSYTLFLGPAPPIKVTTLSQKFERSKTVEVICDPVKCKDVVFKIVKDKETCANVDKTQKILRLNAVEEYQMMKNSKPVGTMRYKTFGDCNKAIAEINANIQIGEVMSQIGKSLTKEEMAIATVFSNAEKASVNYICEQYSTEATDGGMDKLYFADQFDSITQKATITLNRQWMSNNYLCVYGLDAPVPKDGGIGETTKTFTDGRPQRVLIDRIPPQVELDFDPLSLTVTYICIDGPEKPDGLAEGVQYNAGCKQSVGVTYIKDVTKFLPALFKKAQSASQWCPQTGYTAELRSQTFYNSNEVRVMCMKGEDNAGNSAVTMATLYNGYASLASAIQLAIQENK